MAARPVRWCAFALLGAATAQGCQSQTPKTEVLAAPEDAGESPTPDAASPQIIASADASRAQAIDGQAIRTTTFDSRILDTEYYAEGCAWGDFNRDGHVDLLMGPFWYPGPDFEVRHELEPAIVYDFGDPTRRHFMSFTHDFNADGWLDAMSIGYINTDARWYENPGDAQTIGAHWAQHSIFDGVGGEAPLLADLVGDAAPELVFAHEGRLGYASPTADPTAPWAFEPISEPMAFDHGLGVGDIDGDGLRDIVEKRGWYQQLAGSPPNWQFHPVDFSLGNAGGAHMPVMDIDGDGDSDVVSSLDGHGYGLYWFEQTQDGDDIHFVSHEILPPEPGGDNFSQLHAISMADINADGLLDLVTGKRWWAHQGSDPGALDPAVIYWFELQRPTGQLPRFIPHLVHDNSGVGLQVCAGDLTGDGHVDIAASNKKGMSLHVQLP